MLKMRIQHLLEVKSSQERRNLTMDDLSKATEISRSALYKLNSDPDYNPSKEVMEKLVTYFQCTLDDLFDRTTKFTFDLPSAFPSGKALSATVLALLAASNDVTLLQRLWLRYEHESNKGLVVEVRNCEKNFLFFLLLGFLREGMTVFRRLLQDEIARQLFEKMDAESKQAFHYKQEAYFQALRTIQQAKGHFICGSSPAETRFLIADDIRSEVFRASIDFDADDGHVQVGRLKMAMGHLIRFSSGFLMVYLDHQRVRFD